MNKSETVRSYLLAWGRRDIDEARKMLSEDCIFSDPAIGDSVDAEEFLAKTRIFVKTIDGIEILSILEDDTFVGALYCLTTKHFPRFCFSEWFKVEDGKIKEGRLFYDTHPIRSAWQKKRQP